MQFSVILRTPFFRGKSYPLLGESWDNLSFTNRVISCFLSLCQLLTHKLTLFKNLQFMCDRFFTYGESSCDWPLLVTQPSIRFTCGRRWPPNYNANKFSYCHMTNNKLQSFDVNHRKIVICYLSYVICHRIVICHVICHMLFVIELFVICYL